MRRRQEITLQHKTTQDKTLQEKTRHDKENRGTGVKRKQGKPEEQRNGETGEQGEQG